VPLLVLHIILQKPKPVPTAVARYGCVHLLRVRGGAFILDSIYPALAGRLAAPN
jgi:hypothetical protein